TMMLFLYCGGSYVTLYAVSSTLTCRNFRFLSSPHIDFEAWDIAPWTGWHGACRSLFRRTPGSRSPLCCFVSPQFLFRLNAVSLYDRRNQSWKALVDFRASRRVVHLDASPFATN